VAVIDLTARQQLGKAKAKAARERWELLLLQHVRAHGLPPPEREYRFHPRRAWRFDFAWPEVRVAVEVDGGTWTGGRHSTGLGYRRDCEKQAHAAIAGWRVLRVVPEQVRSGEAVAWVRALLGAGVAGEREAGN
jgi:very-short-patch-repair endonuclease